VFGARSGDLSGGLRGRAFVMPSLFVKRRLHQLPAESVNRGPDLLEASMAISRNWRILQSMVQATISRLRHQHCHAFDSSHALRRLQGLYAGAPIVSANGPDHADGRFPERKPPRIVVSTDSLRRS